MLEHEEAGRVADKSSAIVPEGQTEPEYHPDHADHAHGNETLENGGDDVFLPDHASVEEGKSRCHHQDKNSGGDHPGYVGCVHAFVRFPQSGVFRHQYSDQTDDDNQCH